MRVLVIGGTGSFSTRVTQKALERGHEVLIYARGQRPLLGGLSAPMLRGERSSLVEHAAALHEFAPDVVVDSICLDPARAEDLVRLFAAARRVVLISSVDVYGQDVAETVKFMLENRLVKDCAEQLHDDALVDLLARHEAELAALFRVKASWAPAS